MSPFGKTNKRRTQFQGGTMKILLTNLANPLWWKDAARRALYTAVAIALPYLGGSLLTEISWWAIVSAGAVGAIASLATSLAGLPEVEGVDLPWWLAAVERVVKTFGQALAAGLIGALYLENIDWAFILQASAIAALVSLLRLILATLPSDPTVTVPQNVVVINEVPPTVNNITVIEPGEAEAL